MRTVPMLALSLLPIGLVGVLAVTNDTAAATPPPSITVTVDGSDYPVCYVEDCSDQPGQVGVWVDPDTGGRWLSLGGYSLPIRP